MGSKEGLEGGGKATELARLWRHFGVVKAVELLVLALLARKIALRQDLAQLYKEIQHRFPLLAVGVAEIVLHDILKLDVDVKQRCRIGVEGQAVRPVGALAAVLYDTVEAVGIVALYVLVKDAGIIYAAGVVILVVAEVVLVKEGVYAVLRHRGLRVGNVLIDIAGQRDIVVLEGHVGEIDRLRVHRAVINARDGREKHREAVGVLNVDGFRLPDRFIVADEYDARVQLAAR